MAEETKTAETETKTEEPKAKSFEELLAEFNETAKKAVGKGDDDDADEEPEEQDPKKRLQATAKKLREAKVEGDPEMEDLLLERRRAEVVKAVRKSGSDGLEEVDDDFLLDIVIGRIARTPALEKAFIERKANPSGWTKASKVLAADVVERVGKLRKPAKAADRDEEESGEEKPNRAATQAAARAAARATETRKAPNSAQQEEDQRMLGLSNAQFISELRRKGINLGL